MAYHHEDLREWLSNNDLSLKDLGKVIGKTNLSHYTTTGKLFPAEWVEKWQEVYGWSDSEAFLFQYGRPFQGQGDPASKSDEVIEVSLGKLRKLLQA